MKIKAFATTDSKETIEITGLTFWKDGTCYHELTEENFESFLEAVRGTMVIYDNECTAEMLRGKLSAFDQTPLYTNGHENVINIIRDDGLLLWSVFPQQMAIHRAFGLKMHIK